MKAKVLLPTLLLLSCHGAVKNDSNTKSSASANGMPRTIALGASFNQQSNKIGSDQGCVTIPPSLIKASSPNHVVLGVLFDNDYESTKKVINGNLSAKFQMDTIKAEGEVDYLSRNVSTSLSSTVTAYLYTAGGERTIDAEAAGIIPVGGTAAPFVMLKPGTVATLNSANANKGEILLSSCGTEYVSRVSYGSSMLATFKVDWADQSSKEQFEGFIKGDLATGKVKASISAKLKAFFANNKRSFKTSVTFVGDGINALKLNEVMPSGSTLQGCQGQTPDQCIQVFSDMVDGFRNYSNLVSSLPSPIQPPKDPTTAAPVAEGEDADETLTAADTTPLLDILAGPGVFKNEVLLPMPTTVDVLSNMMILDFDTSNYQNVYAAKDTMALNWPNPAIKKSDMESIKVFRGQLTKQFEQKELVVKRILLMGDGKDERVTPAKQAELDDLYTNITNFQFYIRDIESRCYEFAEEGTAGCLDKKAEFDAAIDEGGKYHSFNLGALILPRENFKSWCDDYNTLLRAGEDFPSNLIMTDRNKSTMDLILSTAYPHSIPVLASGDEGASAREISTSLFMQNGRDKKMQLDCPTVSSYISTLDELNLSRQTIETKKVTVVTDDADSNDEENEAVINAIRINGAVSGLEPLLTLRRLISLSLDHQNFAGSDTQDELEKLSNLSSLRSLSLRYVGLKDLKGVFSLKNLRTLALDGNDFSEFVVPAVTNIRTDRPLYTLTDLSLGDMDLPVLKIEGLVRLQKLDLSNSFNESSRIAIDKLLTLIPSSGGTKLTLTVDLMACGKYSEATKSSNALRVECDRAKNLADSYVLLNSRTQNKIEYSANTMVQGWLFRTGDEVMGRGDFDHDNVEEIVMQSSDRIGVIRKNGLNSAILDDSVVDKTTRKKIGTLPFIASTDQIFAIGDFNGDGKDDILFRRKDEGTVLYVASVLSFETNDWLLLGYKRLNGDELSPSDRVIGVANFDTSNRAREIAVQDNAGRIKILGLALKDIAAGVQFTNITPESVEMKVEVKAKWVDKFQVLGVGTFKNENSQGIAVINYKNTPASVAVLGLKAGTETDRAELTDLALDSASRASLAGVELSPKKMPIVFDSDKDEISEVIITHKDGLLLLARQGEVWQIKHLPWGTGINQLGTSRLWFLQPQFKNMAAHQKLATAGDFDLDSNDRELSMLRFSNKSIEIGIFKIAKDYDEFLVLVDERTIFTQSELQNADGPGYINSENVKALSVNHDGGTSDEVFLSVKKQAMPVTYPENPYLNFLSYCQFPSLAADGVTVTRANAISEMNNSLLRIGEAIKRPWSVEADVCQAMNRKLTALDYLDLSAIGGVKLIRDLRPLKGLSNLRSLLVFSSTTGQVNRDDRFMKPLASLKSLRFLDVRNAGIVDAEPLRNLDQLMILNLYGNKLKQDFSYAPEDVPELFLYESPNNPFNYCARSKESWLEPIRDIFDRAADGNVESHFKDSYTKSCGAI